MPGSIDHINLYRLPWSYPDNGISWLEPTSACNMRCEGCYRETEEGVHKSLEEVRSDLEVFKSLRKSDCMSICGGDPLVHPEIDEIVKMSKEMGWKPIINTNGLALTKKRLHALKEAGVFGFTFHIDTSQTRPKVNPDKEGDLNDTRLHFAKMIDDIGGVACSFNSTVSDKTVADTPDIVRWAQKHPRIVQTVVFILYRSPNIAGDKFNVYAQGKKIEYGDTYKETEWGGKKGLLSPEVVDNIREADPLFEPSAYLNGTADPSSFKWLLASRVVMNGKVMGYVSPRFQELVQGIYHMMKGKYLSYVKPKFTRKAKLASFLAGFVDKRMRRIFLKILGQTLLNPLNLFRRAYFQSFMVIQPVTVMPDGRDDMCDSCPDITVHEGRLVWSCRLEELNKHDCFYTFVPKIKDSTH